MPLSCDCGDWDGDGIWLLVPEEFSVLDTKRRKRCKSCKRLINKGESVLEFERFHYAQDDIEERIWGEGCDIPNASWYLCSHCGEIFLNLDDLKFCVNPDENMEDLLEEYRREHVKDNGLFQTPGGGGNNTGRGEE
jgi:hypothetical protein